MSRIFVYDTETTDLPLWKEPSDSPEQPHIVQIAAAVVEIPECKVIQSIDLIVRPEGWEIPPEMTEIHGISTEYATEVGIPEEEAVNMFLALWQDGKWPRVGYVEHFDARIVRIALKRFFPADDDIADFWKDGEKVCAAKLAKEALGNTKNCKLMEAHTALVGHPFENAHTALGDVLATMAVYAAALKKLDSGV